MQTRKKVVTIVMSRVKIKVVVIVAHEERRETQKHKKIGDRRLGGGANYTHTHIHIHIILYPWQFRTVFLIRF